MERFSAQKGLCKKRSNNGLTQELDGFQYLNNTVSDVKCFCLCRSFDLHVQPDLRLTSQLDRFHEERNLFTLPGIQLSNFLQTIIAYVSVSVGCPFQCGIMHQNEFMICGAVNIYFECINPLLYCLAKGQERVFRILGGSAAVCDANN